VKEGKSGRNATSWVVVGGVLIAAAIIALYTPWFRLFDLRRVEVRGNQYLSSTQVVAASGLHRGQTLPGLPAGRVSDRLAELPWVKSASLVRVYPHTVRIEIEERRPIAAVIVDDGVRIVGEGGVVVSSDPSLADGIVEIVGAPLSATQPGGRIADQQLVELLAAIEGLGIPELDVRRVDVSDSASISLHTPEGLRILLGGAESAVERLGSLRALCRAIDIDGYETIDLRFGGEAVLVPRKAVRG